MAKEFRKQKVKFGKFYFFGKKEDISLSTVSRFTVSHLESKPYVFVLRTDVQQGMVSCDEF